ncbi:four helix bundle suffix protein [Desulfobotulus alkaliphilus]|uniref:Four helix bundle suffix protein n=1 Tax=Desulfobotulus alkaliphilus TaxID=622671 RepID=A0A562RY14_9BACT|nr:four helix bundle suffix domain-containing protein [Desulfobotulus alkaliphilus]TWI73937.1 four helix bundle suffix protein [Desulfobotulus alkaliphilus]
MPDLIPMHGGYRKLKSFQMAQLVYDVTVRFCNRYINKFSRTKDQMVQAARSGTQNIAEGSLASATSKKTELKLTQVARASLEELKLDYEDFLRHRDLPMLGPEHPALIRFKQIKPQSLDAFALWVQSERNTDIQRLTGRESQNSQGPGPLSSACLAANGALSLLNLTCYLLDRQVKRLADDFEKEGGFTERMYRIRTERRHKPRK